MVGMGMTKLMIFIGHEIVSPSIEVLIDCLTRVTFVGGSSRQLQMALQVCFHISCLS